MLHLPISFGLAVFVGTLANPPSKVPAPVDDPALLQAAVPAAIASNGFGIELFRAVGAANPDQNVFISPYSMSVALTMAAEGARGETEEQMGLVLHIPASGQKNIRAITPVHAGYAALAARFAAAAGGGDPKTRERANELRRQLDEANAKTEKLSRGESWKEAEAWGSKAQTLAAELNTLLPTLDRFDLRVANALWVERTFTLVPEYVGTIDRYYGTGGVTPLDIARATEASRRTINGWVEEHTEHRIKDLLPANSLLPNTRLVITNAVYFKGEWASPFQASSTRGEDFLLAGGGKVQAKMMQDHWRGGVPYGAFAADGTYFETPKMVPRDEAQRPKTYPDDDGFTMIELPYKGGDLSMVVIAPRTPGGLPALEGRLASGTLERWLARLDRRTVDTAIPRFKMEFEQELSPTLKGMGMKRAFVSPGVTGGADFSGMSAGTDPSDQLYIGQVRHKAWVEVTEKGTEAAAATAIAMAPGAAAMRPEEMVPFNPVFRADHPFLFLIRDTKSGLVLFIGRVATPAT